MFEVFFCYRADCSRNGEIATPSIAGMGGRHIHLQANSKGTQA